MPSKRRLVTSEICFGSEKAGLLENSYNKCALTVVKNDAKLQSEVVITVNVSFE